MSLSDATIEGVPGRPRPTLDESNCQNITVGSGGVLEYVKIIEPDPQLKQVLATPLGISDGGIVDGVVDNGATGPTVNGTGTVENSVAGIIEFIAPGGVAINDTAQVIAVVGATQNGQDSPASATVVNSIAIQKFRAFSINLDGDNPPGPNATASMTLSYYSGVVSTTPPDTGGSAGTSPGTITPSHPVSGALNLAPDGIHETANSSTVDAGTESVTPRAPTDDFDGGVRSFNVPDVGADEFGTGPPALNTITATGVTYKSATIRGTINTNEVDNPSVRFLYGQGTSLSSQTVAHDVPAGTSTVVQQATITGLAPNTTYSFLIESGSQHAQVVSFHTPKKPQLFNGVVFEQHSSQATSKHVVALKLFCPANTVGFCKGSLTLSQARTRLGSATFLANHGNLFTVQITLTSAAFRQLVSTRTEKVVATAAAHDANGTKKTTSASITLTAPPKKG
jgi:hypothetical protein